MDKKKVTFNLIPIIRNQYVWQTASRICRDGQIWQQFARDNERFKRRISLAECKLVKVMSIEHREEIFSERFEKHIYI